jgi:hypothetical protein
MASIEIREVESREQQTPNKPKGSIHILLDRRGLRTREQEERVEPALLRPTRHRTDEGWMKGGTIHDPNQLIGHHDRATKWHKAIPMAHSDAVVIARPKGALWSMWYEHMRWLG